MKKTACFILAILMTVSAVTTSFAAEFSRENELYVIETQVMPRAGDRVQLSVPLYRQNNGYYCGPACVQMVVMFLTNTLRGQAIYAANMGTSSNGSGTIVYRLTNELNAQVGAGSYRYVNTDSVSFSANLISSVTAGKPVVCHVMTGGLPNYNGVSNTGHYVVATGYYASASGSGGVANCYYNDPHYNDAYFGRHTCTMMEMYDAIEDNAGYFIIGN